MVWILFAASSAGLVFAPGANAAPPIEVKQPAEPAGLVMGIVKDEQGNPIANAVVVLQCSCIHGRREVTTNARGLYRFEGLPPGQYTIQVLSGAANVSKVMTLPKDAKFRANFEINPNDEIRRMLVVESSRSRRSGRTRTRKSRRRSAGRVMGGVPGGVAGGVPGGVVGGSVGGLAAKSTAVHRTRVHPSQYHQSAPSNREGYASIEEHEFHIAKDTPLSTFSVDVDTASYANVRRFLDSGQRPPAAAVRIEELINYFDYDDPAPKGDGDPFAIHGEVGPCPWNSGHKLVRLSLQTRKIEHDAVPPRNLVFLIDTSGSMSSADKLELLERSLHMLVDELREQDRVAIVTYAGSSRVALRPVSGARKQRIHQAIDELGAGGSTHGAEGIRTAYELANRSFRRGGVNRVILGTDGDFNVGVSSDGELRRLIENERKSGVFLSVLGFGTGNLQDAKMELLADEGNGNYAYIDSLFEARKVLVRESGATLVTVAKDVKLQVEFNPSRVRSYRLIGYENRKLEDRDFNDDTKDAGEIGAGHHVTALYEVVPAPRTEASEARSSEIDPLRYQGDRAQTRHGRSNELLTVKVRHKTPHGTRSRLQKVEIHDRGRALSRTSDDFRFAAAVAGFGMILRDSPHRGSATLRSVRALAVEARGKDEEGYRAEFVGLVRQASRMGYDRRVAVGDRDSDSAE